MTVPAEAWQRLTEGNQRFAAGEATHPRQDAARIAELAGGQFPVAAVLGCSDSRVSAELLFDQGLGDLFVVRNAGQVVDETVVGSLEYAVAVLKVPLIVVLRHDSCGAVKAAIDSLGEDAAPLPAHISSLVSRIEPAVRQVAHAKAGAAIDTTTVDSGEVGAAHLRASIASILEQSELVSDAIAAGTLAIVGAGYRLAHGAVEPDLAVGAIESLATASEL